MKTVTVQIEIRHKTPHAAAAARKAAAKAVRCGDVTTIPARFTMGDCAMDLSVVRHDD